MRWMSWLAGLLCLAVPFACFAADDPYLLTLNPPSALIPRNLPQGYLPVSINEDAALRAVISKTGLWIPLPDGSRMHLDYRTKIMHSDGTWTFVGSISGEFKARKALITFGDHAVFGSVPSPSHSDLILTTWHGGTWLVDPSLSAKSAPMARSRILNETTGSDRLAVNAPYPTGAVTLQSEATASNPATIDLLVVYTTDFRTSFGSTSAAIARIDYLVDTANQVFQDSQVYGRIRVVHTAEVPYTGDPWNAVGDLSGTNGSVPALSSVDPMRALYGADAVTMMQMYRPDTYDCGGEWPMGQNHTPITATDASKAYSVLEEDSSLDCDLNGDGLAEVLGENFGLVPAIEDNAGTGAYPFSRAYIGTLPNTGGGQVCTLLAKNLSSRLGCEHVPYLSNPNIDLCGGPCGVPDQSDAARSLNLTLPIIATFKPTEVGSTDGTVRNDIDGDGGSDLLFQNPSARDFGWWLMNGTQVLSTHDQAITAAGGYTVVATGDFNGDGKVDIVWINKANAIYIWSDNGGSFTSHYVTTLATGWQVVGAGDVDGDGKDDLLFQNPTAHYFGWWLMNGAKVLSTHNQAAGTGYQVAGTGDFNGDGKTDIAWTNSSRAIVLWMSTGTGFSGQHIAPYGGGWHLVGVGDVDGDGNADLLFQNSTINYFGWWLMNGSQVLSTHNQVTGAGYHVGATGDFNGDGKTDLAWSNAAHALVIWSSAGSAFNGQHIQPYGSGWTLIP